MSAESKSPFGEVDGFMISGVSREQDRVIRVVVRITTDGGLNSFLMTECADSSTLEWEGTGKMTFTMRHKEQRLEMVMTCLHDAEEKVLRVSPVVYFRPFGWVRLRDQKLLLDRGSVAYSVPVDIEEERLSSSAHAVEEPTLETELNNLRRLHSHMGVSQDRDQTVNSPTDYANLPSTRLSRWKPVNGGKRPRFYLQVPGAGLPPIRPHWEVAVEEARIAKEEDTRRRRTFATQRWGPTLNRILRGIFGDPIRRRSIVSRWHERNPTRGVTVTEIFTHFIESIMDAPRSLVVTSHGFLLFDNESLLIPYLWLTLEERMFFVKMYVHRAEIFQDSVAGYSNQFWLRGCLLDGIVNAAVCPRQVVQEFSLVTIDAALSRRVPVVLLNLIAAVRACIHRKAPTVIDKFLLHLSAALQQREVKEGVEQLGMLVAIAGEAPEIPDIASRFGNDTAMATCSLMFTKGRNGHNGILTAV